MLLALAMIFLPVLFNGGRPHQIETLKEFPPIPAPIPQAGEKPEVPDVEAPPAADKLYELDPDEISTHTKNLEQRPELNQSGVPNAWAGQVGSFSDKAKARELSASLQRRGYKAFTRAVVKNDKPVTRVLVGPYLRKQQAASVKKEVDAILGVNSLLLTFEP